MSTLRTPQTLGWPEVIADNAAEVAFGGAPDRTAPRLRGLGARVLPAARALEPRRGAAADRRRTRGRAAARGRSGRDRASAGWRSRSRATCSSSQPTHAEGGSWYSQPSSAELLDWEPVLTRAGVHASPNRVAKTYLELAVFVRALESLSDAVRMRLAPDRSSLWAGLFDLRENLLGRTLEDLRALAAYWTASRGRLRDGRALGGQRSDPEADRGSSATQVRQASATDGGSTGAFSREPRGCLSHASPASSSSRMDAVATASAGLHAGAQKPRPWRRPARRSAA